MRPILAGVLTWSIFSAEKKLFFNGYALRREGETALIDPPPLAEEDLGDARLAGGPYHLVITNKDHRRGAADWRDKLSAKLWVHEADAPLLGIPADATFRGGERLPAGLRVVHLPDQKSPGESGLHLDDGDGVLFVGDAVLGVPPGRLRMLPAEKYADLGRARDALRGLLDLRFEALLVGDGTPLLRGGREALGGLLGAT